MKLLRFLALAVIVINSAFALANNPTPFVNQPLIPASIPPGGPDFTLTVNGTGFVSGSTVNWNGSPRATTFVNASQLTATILSTDIVTASTASVTVVSPSPGGGASNVVFLPVRQPASFVSFTSDSFGTQFAAYRMAVADFNKDGIQDMAVGIYDSNSIFRAISILGGKGDGTFSQGPQYPVGQLPTAILSADINRDGIVDLVDPNMQDLNGQYGLGVMIGKGDGTFRQPVVYPDINGRCCSDALGDFNRDGAIDMALTAGGQVCILPGNGDGSFQAPVCSTLIYYSFVLTVGDFNADGKLDLGVLGSDGQNQILAIFLGNGHNTFQTFATYPIAGSLGLLTAADVNGDGKLDLIVPRGDTSEVAIFLGNGDGSFQAPTNFPTGYGPYQITPADLNGDGKLDLLVGEYGFYINSISVLLGNGDGTFQNYTTYYGSGFDTMQPGDFNDDGRLDVAVTNGGFNTITILTQDDGTVVTLSKYSLTFPIQLVNTVSDPRLVTLTNNGADPVKVSKINTPANFSQLSNCTTVQSGKSCKIGVFFTPTSPGDITGFMTIFDDGGGSPQIVNLSGTATVVSFSPTKLDFGSLQVGKVSNPQSVLLTNEGNSNLSISEIGIGGADPNDFSEVNACPNKLPAGASCTITVFFHPRAQGTRNAILGAKDGGGGSPQKAPLTGTGT